MATSDPGGSLGRPRSFDTAAVIDRAVDVLWRDGFKGATTRRLGDELGVSQSSLYNAFGSKAQLQELALDRYERSTASALLEPLEAETPHTRKPNAARPTSPIVAPIWT